MEKDRKELQQFMEWLSDQINHANEVINESHKTNNVGREVQYEGMRDAFMRCFKMLAH